MFRLAEEVCALFDTCARCHAPRRSRSHIPVALEESRVMPSDGPKEKEPPFGRLLEPISVLVTYLIIFSLRMPANPIKLVPRSTRVLVSGTV